MMRCGVVGVALGMCVAWASAAGAACAGDCDGDGTVTIAELVTAINLALGVGSLGECRAADVDGDGAVSIAEAIAAVQVALNGCTVGPRCPIITVAGDDGSVLTGPGLAVQPGGGFAVVTGHTAVTSGAPPRASGEVLLHRYAADGTPAAVQRLAARHQVIRAPRLANLPNGGGIAAWGEADPRNFGLPIARLAVRRFGANGAPLNNVASIARAGNRHELSAPGLAADSGGNALITWMDREQTTSGSTAFRGALRRQRPTGLDATGSLRCFGDPLAVTTGATLDAVCVAIDVDPMQVVLRAFQLAQNDPVLLADFSSAGPFGAIGAAASADRIVVVWLQPLETPLRASRVLVQVAGLDGVTLLGPLEIGEALDTLVAPAVALQANGGFAVAFGEGPLQVRRFAADGTPVGEPVVVANTRVDELALDADADGNLVVAWRWRDVLALQIPAAEGGICR